MRRIYFILVMVIISVATISCTEKITTPEKLNNNDNVMEEDFGIDYKMVVDSIFLIVEEYDIIFKEVEQLTIEQKKYQYSSHEWNKVNWLIVPLKDSLYSKQKEWVNIVTKYIQNNDREFYNEYFYFIDNNDNAKKLHELYNII